MTEDTFQPVPKFAADYPPVAETLEQARLTFYCCNCYRKAETRFLTPNFGPFCEACLTEAKEALQTMIGFAAARPAPARPAWQPIDTAPKGKSILVSDGQRIGVGGIDPVWGLDFDQGAPFEQSVTHWQALPPPPEAPER